MSDNKIIGAELYWRFAEFETKLKSNWNTLLGKINDNFLDTIPISDDLVELWDWFAYYSELDRYGCVPSNAVKNPLIIELGLKEEIRQKQSIPHLERVKKLSLGFYVQLLKFDNIKTIGIAYDEKYKPNNRTYYCNILSKYIFPGYARVDSRFFMLMNYINTQNNERLHDYYAECSMIQDFRNDFCHFRFNIEKFEEAKTLLDKYIAIL